MIVSKAGKNLKTSGPFVLGTAQFGLAYGLGDAQLGLSEECVKEILDAARSFNVRWLDTARNYGRSENRIGAYMVSRAHRFKIISKLPSLATIPDVECKEAVQKSITESLCALGVPQIEVYLTHHAADFRRPAVIEALGLAQASGMIGSYGASVYSPEDAAAALEVAGLSVLQFPMNVLSNEVIGRGITERAGDKKVLVLARSVFLQGVLLWDPEKLPQHLASLAPVLANLRRIADEDGVPLPALLMAAIGGLSGLSSLIIGVDSARQLGDLVEQSDIQPTVTAIERAFRVGTGLPTTLTDPRAWPSRPGDRKAYV